MPRLILAADRIVKARALIKKAYDLPMPPGSGRFDLSYIAQVKDILRQARDLVKFIPNTPSATPEIKGEVTKIFKEIEEAEKAIFHKTSSV